ncbi:hypothetical protein SCHPADRAFT_502760 [Schizopora paradoxa]|uniref:Uncharacterized protein n=1 Tax=Schizopora paradoxa TaxID=27342 RepID=A0A0H2RFV6_9AGAM|nr:hypothetical protein SCHPADRAFT_502760 [Schizopora paradoxa]
MALSYTIHFVFFVDMSFSLFSDSTGNNAFMTHTISVTMMSRLILNLKSFDDRQTRRRSTRQSNRVAGFHPSALFTTDISDLSSWIARTASELASPLESEEFAC